MANEIYGTKTVFDTYDTVFIEFDDVEALRAIKHEIETNPKAVISFIDSLIDKSEERLVERQICPVCGDTLRAEKNGYDNYVPYGSTYVCESEGYDLVCDSCGFRREQ